MYKRLVDELNSLNKRIYDILNNENKEVAKVSDITHLLDTDPLLYQYILSKATYDQSLYNFLTKNYFIVLHMIVDIVKNLYNEIYIHNEKITKLESLEEELRNSRRALYVVIGLLIAVVFWMLHTYDKESARAIIELFKSIKDFFF